MFKISSIGPIECNFKTLSTVVFRPGAGSYFTQSPITVFQKKISQRNLFAPSCKGMPKFEDFKSLPKIRKLSLELKQNNRTIFRKWTLSLKKFSICKIELWQTCRKKTAKRPEHLAQCLNNCNKSKLFKNIISFFSSKDSSVQSECRFDKSAANFSLDVREVFTKLPKYLREVTIRRRPLSGKVSPRQVKSNFVEPD